MLMEKLFIYNLNKFLQKFTPTFLFLSVFFLFHLKCIAFEFQCYQKFIKSKPFVLIKFSIPAKELVFQDIRKQCIAEVDFQIQWVKNHKMIFEKQYSKVYYLYDFQDYSTTNLIDSLWIQGVDYGEYDVHFSIEQISKSYYQKKHFVFENQWYRVNIDDIEVFNLNKLPIFDKINNNEDSILLKFSFQTDFSFPLTLRIQIFSPQNEQPNPFAIAYQSIYQAHSTINLKKGKNYKWIKIPLNKIFTQKYFLEVNFFEEENFVLSKKFELQCITKFNELRNQIHHLFKEFIKKGISLPQSLDDYTYDSQEVYLYLQNLLNKSENNNKKLKNLINLGLPDKIIHNKNEEIWYYFKYNRKIRFIKS